MRINNNDLIQEAIKRRGLELDRPFKAKYNELNYATLNEEQVFELSLINGEYVLRLAKDKNITSLMPLDLLFDIMLLDLLFDNKNDIEIEFVGDKEIKPIDVKRNADKLYCKYIKLAKEHNKNNSIEPTDFIGGAKRIFESNKIIAKLELLSDILGYDYRKVSNDIKGDW